MRRVQLRSRFPLALALILFCTSAAFAWVQSNLRDIGFADVGLRLSGDSITFVLEQDGSFSTNPGEPASELNAIRATFTAINGITTSDATAVDGGTFDFVGPIVDDEIPGGIAADGVNKVYFFNSDANGDFGGLAAAFFFVNTTTGIISGCDIAFNNTPASGFVWSVATPADPNTGLGPFTFDIQEVMNQEVQHCFGAEHTPVAGRFDAGTGKQVSGFTNGDFSLQASLYPFATGTIQGRTFEPDDMAFFGAVYPSATANTQGSISGTVRFSDNTGVKGAHVVAVPQSDPTKPIVGYISSVDENADVTPGNYRLTGLPPDTYLVRIEPLDGVSHPFTEGNTFFSGFVTNFPPEFYSGAAESSSDLTIGSSDAMPVTVFAGVDTPNINIIVNVVPPVPPPNDDFANATVIGAASFTDMVNTTAATTEATDPKATCSVATGADGRSVWYGFTPASNGSITATTAGSSYDTVLSVHTGSPGAFTEVACNDDVNFPVDVTSSVTFPSVANTTYHFKVSAFGGSAGGNLTFNFTSINASFRGRVKNRLTGLPIRRATVEALQGGVVIFSTTTNRRGKFTLAVTAGTYDLRASKPRFKPQTKFGQAISSGQTIGRVVFRLRPR